MQKQTVSLLILAAGIGRRFKKVKQFEKLGKQQKTLIDYSLNDAYKLGIKKAVFVIRQELYDLFQKEIAQHWQDKIKIQYVYQELTDLPAGKKIMVEREKPWGTGHAVFCARKMIDDRFITINADDYYGEASLELLYNYLVTMPENRQEHAMVTFPLGQTFSPNGNVSRGVCQVNGNQLEKIVEYTHLTMSGEKIYCDDAERNNLKSNTPVSMNLWGFTPDIFSWLEKKFIHFLDSDKYCKKNDEYFLPGAVNSGIKENIFTVAALPCDSKWFGLTYSEDVIWVEENLKSTM